MSDCDRFWFKANHRNIIALAVSLPLSIMIPATSFIIPVIILFRVCTGFIGANIDSQTHEDSIRFIMSLPFSRKQIADAYIKGLLYIAIGYSLLIIIISAGLSITNISWVLLWSNPLNSAFDVFVYIVLFIFSILFACVSNINLLSQYDDNRVTQMAVAIFIIAPILWALQYMKAIFHFIAYSVFIEDMTIGSISSYLLKRYFHINNGVPDKAINGIVVVIFLPILGFLIYWIVLSIMKQHKEFTFGRKLCSQKPF